MPINKYGLSVQYIPIKLKNTDILYPNRVRRACAKEIQKFTQAVIKYTKKYPRIPYGSRYVRTHNLGDSWENILRMTDELIQVEIRNEAYDKWHRYYFQYVHGDGQTWFHRKNHWIRLADAIDENEFVDTIAEIIDNVIHEKGY